MLAPKKKPKLILVDGHSLAFRSFYAFTKGGEGGLMTKEGLPTSVTYGFLKSLLDNCKALSPQGMVIAFDTAEPTFRHKYDTNYKANRDVAPEIFFDDLDRLKLILKELLGLSISSVPGYEADDVLGTIATKASSEGWKVMILSGDRDLFQLVDDSKDISVLYMGGGPYSRSAGPVLIDEAGVLNKLGVLPNKVVDFKALTGDSSDNIPGVKGVGPKTAIKLLDENNDLDSLYDLIERLKLQTTSTSSLIKGNLKDKLIRDKENAYLSRYLAKIIVDVPLDNVLAYKFTCVNKQALLNRLQELELNSLSRQVSSFCAAFSPGGYKDNYDSINSEFKEVNPNKKIKEKDYESIPNNQVPVIKPKIIKDEDDLDFLLKKLESTTDVNNPISLDTETTNLNPFKAELVGLGFCWGDQPEDISYLPIAHKDPTYGTNQLVLNQLPLTIVLEKLNGWIKSDSHPKVLQNSKYDRLVLLRHGIQINGVILDTLLADYLVDSNAKHSLEELSQRYFNFKPTSFSEIVPKGKTFADISIETASRYCGMDVYLTRKLSLVLRRKLKAMGSQVLHLYDNVEKPLEAVLATMEATGVRVDLSYLKTLSQELTITLKELETKVFSLSGYDFNLSSPKQLGELLFDNLELDRKKSRRTKTGWSTDATVLERLQTDHDIIPLILEHRILTKLQTTYVDALPNLVEKETGRVHTDFNQAVTSTGRLSSSNPNLQNIPIRTAFSRRIRKAFIPQDNWLLLSADYSQIELRILAHLSNESVLQEAYRNSEDVHSLTARILLDKSDISEEERRLGKTINFGVIYGMGSQRLARSTGLTNLEAKNFLKKYKDRYQNVFSYLELQERLALTQGYVETILGRRRNFVFDKNGLGRLYGKDPHEIDLTIARRAGLEAQQLRAAANAPIQGSSADIIKLAMVALSQKISELSLPARILLQVHDELVLEVDPIAKDEISKIVVETMESAVKLTVPLVVEIGQGENWMDAK